MFFSSIPAEPAAWIAAWWRQTRHEDKQSISQICTFLSSVGRTCPQSASGDKTCHLLRPKINFTHRPSELNTLLVFPLNVCFKYAEPFTSHFSIAQTEVTSYGLPGCRLFNAFLYVIIFLCSFSIFYSAFGFPLFPAPPLLHLLAVVDEVNVGWWLWGQTFQTFVADATIV